MLLSDYFLEAYPGLKLSQADAEFAEKIGTSRQNIARYRLFQRFPTPVMIAKIRRASGGLVTADDHLPPDCREIARERKARA